MLKGYLAEASEDASIRWLVAAGATSAGAGAVSIGSAVGMVQHVIPASLLVTNYLYISLALSLFLALPLYFARIVLFLALAQYGVLTGIIYLGFAFKGLFPGSRLMILQLVAVVIIAAFVLSSLRWVGYLYTHRQYDDLFVWVFLTIMFIVIWSFALI
jgi:hypothetical protein